MFLPVLKGIQLVAFLFTEPLQKRICSRILVESHLKCLLNAINLEWVDSFTLWVSELVRITRDYTAHIKIMFYFSSGTTNSTRLVW